ncbi:hypothetical protein [Amycolatopsis sp. NPDC049868]|uniref:hypothetical protein n=1 Tax=Amycolatopsis sp. NPDC049868 TaxID=3363934 RepID=UPI0037898002
MKDFDLVELLNLLAVRCTELLSVSAAALLLAPPETGLRPMTTSGSDSGLSDLLAVAQYNGPARESHREVTSVGPVDIGSACCRWPDFCGAAENAGYLQVCSVPM